MDPSPNAHTQGDTRIFVNVTSGLIEMLEEDELRAAAVHECGHIACRHVLYHTMVQMMLQYGAAIFGPLAAPSMPVQLGLLYWVRRSELSADRGGGRRHEGVPVGRENDDREAGGSKFITGRLNLDLYLKQAEAYDKLQESQWDKFLQGVAVVNMDHPFLCVRAREITRWCQTEQFQHIVQVLEKQGWPKCPTCGAAVRTNWNL